MIKKTLLSIVRPLALCAVVALLPLGLRAQYVSTAFSNNLAEPFGVAQDNNLNVYVTDANNERILEYVPSTTNLSTLAGSFGVPGSANGTGTAAQFNNPQGIVFARGGLIVVDQGNEELRYVSPAGVVTNLAGTLGVPGTNDGAALGGAQFYNPTGIAADSAGNLYVADQGSSRIRKISTANVVSTIGANHAFYLPTAVTVDNNNNVWVADMGNQQICMISNGVTVVEAGTRRVVGTNDTSLVNHTGALFNQPSGLYFDTISNVLIICDTGNDTLRKLSFTNFQGVNTNVVQTLSGFPGTPGWVDGPLASAQFNQPAGITADTTDTGYYVVDTGNNALRIVQPVEPPPPPTPIANPILGYLTFPLNGAGIEAAQFNPFPTNSPVQVFNNEVYIAIEQSDQPTASFVSSGATGSVSAPTGSSPTALMFNYPNDYTGYPPNGIPVSILDQFSPLPDLTIEVVSTATGRPSSGIVRGRIQFVMGNPSIIGNNGAAVVLDDITTNAQIYYTVDGNPPTNGAADTFGPVGTNTTISFPVVSNTTLSVQALPQPGLGFAPSGVVTATFSPTNFSADQLTFGFESGECSSEFITAPGQTFIAPVTLTLIPSAESMDSLQFSLAVTTTNNGSGTPPMVPFNSVTFSSMLEKPIPGTSPPAYEYIPTQMVTTNGFTNLLFTNTYSNIDLVGVGWLESYPATNLYNTQQQTLITFSEAHDTQFLNTGGRVICGAFSFHVPTGATVGQQYLIQIGSPSATLDGIATPVYVEAVTNGSLTNGPINSTKLVTVGKAKYLVGDVEPFYWFNAGDFGDQTLQANDVSDTFVTGVYGANGPTGATAGSDYFDAMDSSDGLDNNLYVGTDTSINNILYGDGIIAVDDVYVTFRRSLDPSLSWVERADTAAGKVATVIPSGLTQAFSGVVAAPAVQSQGTTNTTSGPRYITVAGDRLQGGANQTVQVPIRVLAADSLPITVMMLHLEVEALDGSPAITTPVSFTPAPGLGSAFTGASQGPDDFASVWLNSTNSGVSGTNILGTLSVTLPSTVSSNSAYLVHFGHFSASPNGLALFHTTLQDGLITVGSRTNSSWGDGIPDWWRLLWFSSAYNPLSSANADPDGDGASNWEEYVAGTNPNDATSVFQFVPGSFYSGKSCALQWASVVNKTYSVQRSPTLVPATWTTVATNLIGTGQVMQWQDNNAPGTGQFYRASVQ